MDPQPLNTQFRRQFLLGTFYIMEKLFIFLMRVNMCMILRFQFGLSELQATLYFHCFQTCMYLTAFVSGQFAMNSFKPFFIMAPFFYAAAFFTMAVAVVLAEPSSDISSSLTMQRSQTFAIMSLMLFGVSQGMNMVCNLKVVEYDLQNRFMRRVMIILAVLEIVINLIFVEIFDSIPQGLLIDFFIGSLSFFMAIIFLCQISMSVLFYGQSHVFSDYKEGKQVSVFVYNVASFFWRSWLMAIKQGKRVKKLIKRRKGEQLEDLDMDKIPFDEEFVNDMKMKSTHHSKLMLILPGIFLAFEIRYSFWIFALYRMKRSFIPVQVIFSYQQLILILCLVAFCFWLNPAFRYTWFYTPLRKMGLGSFFILVAITIGVLVVFSQEHGKSRPGEPYFDQTKVTIRNGLNCDVFIKNRIDVTFQQYLHKQPMKIEVVSARTHHPLIKPTYKEYLGLINKNDELYDAMVNAEEPLDYVTGLKAVEDYDSAVYYPKVMPTDPKFRGIQSIALEPLDCSYASYYNIPLLKPVYDHSFSNNMTLIVVGPTDLTVMTVPFTRPYRTDPGLRFLFANKTPIDFFAISRNNQTLEVYPHLNNLNPKDFFYFEKGDGPNIEFDVDGVKMGIPDELQKGALFDVVFITEGEKISAFKMYRVEAAPEISFGIGILQYTFLAIGEFLFGVIGIRFLLHQTPHRLHFHVLLDWHFVRGLASILIIICIKCQLFLTFFWQMSAITIYCAISILIFVIAASLYVYVDKDDVDLERNEE